MWNPEINLFTEAANKIYFYIAFLQPRSKVEHNNISHSEGFRNADDEWKYGLPESFSISTLLLSINLSSCQPNPFNLIPRMKSPNAIPLSASQFGLLCQWFRRRQVTTFSISKACITSTQHPCFLSADQTLADRWPSIMLFLKIRIKT